MNSIDYDYIIYFLAFLCLIIPARDLIVRKNKKGLHKISFAGWWFIVCAVLLTVVSIGKSRSNQNDEKYNHDYGAINGELKDKKNKVPRLSVGCQAEPFGNPNGNILDLSKVLGIELIVMIENEQLLVTTTVTDSTGIQLATLTKNEWTVNPNGKFDRNFDDKAIEVKDEYGKIVLQVEFENDIACVSGFFYSNTSHKTIVLYPSTDTNVGGGYIQMTNKPDTLKEVIHPIFKYPSGLHKGERVSNVNHISFDTSHYFSF